MCLEHPANAKEGYVFLSLLIWIKHSWADQAQFGQYLIRQLARVQWSQKGSVCSFRNDATTLLQPVNASTAWNQPCLKLPLTFNLALQAKMDTSDLSPSPGLNTVTWISLVRSLSMESPYKKSFFFFFARTAQDAEGARSSGPSQTWYSKGGRYLVRDSSPLLGLIIPTSRASYSFSRSLAAPQNLEFQVHPVVYLQQLS